MSEEAYGLARTTIGFDAFNWNLNAVDLILQYLFLLAKLGLLVA